MLPSSVGTFESKAAESTVVRSVSKVSRRGQQAGWLSGLTVVLKAEVGVERREVSELCRDRTRERILLEIEVLLNASHLSKLRRDRAADLMLGEGCTRVALGCMDVWMCAWWWR